jgi:hypothetical protein
MRKLLILAAATLIAAPLVAQTPPKIPAQGGKQTDPDKAVKGGGKLPPEWKARFDQAGTKMDAVGFENTGTGLHITTGPAAIYYPPQAQSGKYRTQATFIQVKPSAHPEAYGLFIGGSNLQAETQKYTYFVINQTGKFLIKRRAGAETPTVMNWTDSPAIHKADASGKMTNALSIDVGQDTVRFLINNTEVAARPIAELDTKGQAGIRINHNLDVIVEALMMSADVAMTRPKN